MDWVQANLLFGCFILFVVLPPESTNVYIGQAGSTNWNCKQNSAKLRLKDKPISTFCGSGRNWEAVDKVLLDALQNKTFPGTNYTIEGGKR